MIEKLAIAHMNKIAGIGDFTGFGGRLGSELKGGVTRQGRGIKSSFERNILKGSKDKDWGAWKTVGNMATLGLPLLMLGLMGGRAVKGMFSKAPKASFMGVKPKHLYAGIGGIGAMRYFGPRAAKKVGMGGMNPYDAAAYSAGIKR